VNTDSLLKVITANCSASSPLASVAAPEPFPHDVHHPQTQSQMLGCSVHADAGVVILTPWQPWQEP